MGFSLNLLIVFPDRKEIRNHLDQRSAPKNYTVWRVNSVVHIGDVTRLEKITAPHFKHIQFSGERRAGICVTNDLFLKLCDKIKRPAKKHFVPPFTIIPRKPGRNYFGFYEWQEECVSFKKIRNGMEFTEFTSPIDHRERAIPTFEIMEKHNAAIGLRREEFSKRIRNNYRIILDTPLIWESCEVVANWLAEMETSQTEAWSELIKDPVAIAYYRTWRSYLAEIGKIGPRAIFLFETIYTGSFI